MTIETRKLELIQLLLEEERASALDIIEQVLRPDISDNNWQLSPEQQRSLEKSLDQADAGKTTPHDVVMKRIKAKFNL